MICDLIHKRYVKTDEDLLRFLKIVAHHKTVEANRPHLGTRKRDVNRKRSLHDLDHAEHQTLVSDDPRPERLAIAQEEYDRLLAVQPSPIRAVLKLLRDSYTYGEVAARLRINVKTVQRRVAAARRILKDRECGR